MLLKKVELNDHLLVNIGIIMKMGLISAFAAVKYYFNQKQNLMQAVAGQAFSKLVKVKKLMS